MEKRTIIAVILIATVLFIYQLYVAKYYPRRELASTEAGSRVMKSKEVATETFKEKEKGLEEISERKTISEPISPIPTEEVTIETEKFIVTLSNDGGCIKSIILKEYPLPDTNEVFKLVDTSEPEHGIFNIVKLNGKELSRVRFVTNKKAHEVIFFTKLENGLELTKRYIFNNSLYNIELELSLYNLSEKPLNIGYSIVAGSNIDIATKLDRRYTQVVSNISGKLRRDNGRKGEGLFVEGIVKYTGLQNKYFSLMAKPSMATQGLWVRQIDNDNLLSELEIGKFTINPKTSASHSLTLYAGPTKMEIMQDYGLTSAVSYGVFGGISEILLGGLNLFHRIFKNWGVAIILLSALVNLLLFPLSRKSYESMKKMQELQPHLEKLRSEHKNNPHRLNKEMIELYKRYKVNPMGGCLPMFLQIPIFVALYQALMRSLDLRGARFLWIRDLSMPDAVRLPFTIFGLGNTVNILPILMAGAMLIQQKLATLKSDVKSGQARQQQQMMLMMPILFLFLMYNFPSGLVLYWLINTLLTMLEQRGIMHP